MADYYVQYSFQLKNLKLEQIGWLEDYISRVEESAIEAEEYVSLGEWEFLQDSDDLDSLWHMWFHGYEGFSDDIADMFQAFLKEYPSWSPYIAFEWANTCSKDRLDAFSGGACFVTAEKAEWYSTRRFIEEKAKEFDPAEKYTPEQLVEADLTMRAKVLGLSAEVITAFAPAQLEEVVRKLEEKNDDNTE